MSSPFPSGANGLFHGGPGEGGHAGPHWFDEFGMDLGAPVGTAAHTGRMRSALVDPQSLPGELRPYLEDLVQRTRTMCGSHRFGPDFGIGRPSSAFGPQRMRAVMTVATSMVFAQTSQSTPVSMPETAIPT